MFLAPKIGLTFFMYKKKQQEMALPEFDLVDRDFVGVFYFLSTNVYVYFFIYFYLHN